MTGIFETVLNMSITGAYIASAIIVIRLLMKKLPKRYSYALWSILAIRLLCPISFSSVVSFFNLFKPTVVENEMTYIPSDIVYADTPAVNVGTPVINEAVNGVLPTATAETSVNTMQLILYAASVVWLIGIAAMITYSAVSYFAVKKRVASAIILRDNVYLCDGIETPFVYGIIKPKIYIPTSVSEADTDYILAHERVHISRGDHIIKLIALAALSLHWFNPLAWVSFKLMTNDMELSCDERALTKFDRDVKKDYASALLSISIKQNRLSYGGLLSFGESNIKTRIKGVLSAKKPALVVSVIAVAVIAVAAVCLLTNANGNDKHFTEVVSKDYASFMMGDTTYDAETQYRERTPAQMSEFMEKLKKTKVKLIKKETVTEENIPPLNTDYDRASTMYCTVRLHVLENCDGEYTGVVLARVSRGEESDVMYIALYDQMYIYSYEISDKDWEELSVLFNESYNNIIYSITNSKGTEMITLERAGIAREFTFDEVAPFMYKLNNTKNEQIDGSKLTFADGGHNYTVSLYSEPDNRANYSSLDIASALSENGEQIYCISLLNTNVYSVYKISEEDYNELTRLFDLGFDRNYDGLQTTVPGETEYVPEPVYYDDEYKLCEDYLTAYFNREEEPFYPSRYINDTDMLVYVNAKLAYERNNSIQTTVLGVKIHTDSAERSEADDGTIILRVPYEVSYRYDGNTGDSGYGRVAYFEVKSTDDGWKIYRVCDCGTTDYLAFGYDIKDLDSFERLTFDLAEGTSSLGGNTTYEQFSVVFPAENITMEMLQDYGTGGRADVVEPFTADFILPAGWTVRYPSENEKNQVQSGNWAKNIYNKDGNLIGAVSFDVFDNMDGVPDEEYYKVAYSGIRLGSIVSLGDITPVSKTGAGENAVSVVMVNQMDNSSAAGSTVKEYPVALSYNKLLGVYVRIDFNEGEVTDEQLNTIAKSIWIKAKAPDITVSTRESVYPLGVEEITIDITNNSSETFKYYKDVLVVYNDAGEWKTNSSNSVKTDGKYVSIEAGKTYSDKVSMKSYDVSKEGEYKICIKDDLGDNYYATQEFEIVKEKISETEATAKDFDFNIYTEKQVYTTNEDIKVYADVKYIGSEKQLDVIGGFSCISFNINGTKYFTGEQGAAVTPAISQKHTFKKNELVRYDFTKSGGWSQDEKNAEFYKQFYSIKDLKYPADEYTVTAVFSCYTDENDASGSTITIQKSIKIKVVEAAGISEADAIAKAQFEIEIQSSNIKSTITNFDKPKVEKVTFTTEPNLYLCNGVKTVVGNELYKVTFTTTEDAVLGPIVYYIDSTDGKVSAMDYRE